jgi:proline dehydrogenase
VRLTKGIYVESPTIQFHDFDAVRASFVKALDGLLEARCYVGVATHDDWLVEQGKRLVAEHGIGFDRHEFQLLLGVRPELGDRLVAEGHRLRIYVPFGREWYAYSMRRLQENPRVAGYIAADTVNRLLPGSRGNGVR